MTWDNQREYVMRELDRHADEIDQLNGKVNALHYKQAEIGVRQGIWGAIGSSLPVLAYVIYEFMKSKGG